MFSAAHSATMAAGSFHNRAPLDLNVRNITLLNKPTIDIQLDKSDGSNGSYLTSFSTMEKIEGSVNITAKNDTKFDELEIGFIGRLASLLILYASILCEPEL